MSVISVVLNSGSTIYLLSDNDKNRTIMLERLFYWVTWIISLKYNTGI